MRGSCGVAKWCIPSSKPCPRQCKIAQTLQLQQICLPLDIVHLMLQKQLISSKGDCCSVQLNKGVTIWNMSHEMTSALFLVSGRFLKSDGTLVSGRFLGTSEGTASKMYFSACIAQPKTTLHDCILYYRISMIPACHHIAECLLVVTSHLGERLHFSASLGTFIRDLIVSRETHCRDSRQTSDEKQ